MKRFKFSKEYAFLAIVFVVFLILSIIFWKENPQRLLIIGGSLVILLVSFLLTRNLMFSSFLYILIILPFNITYQLPPSVSIFNTQLILSNPYVNGLYVNYLIPTLSILDLGITLFLLTFLIGYGKRKFLSILRGYGIFLPIFTVFLLLQNIIIGNPLTILNSLRFLIYLLFLLTSIEWFKESGKKLFKGILLALIPIVFIQGVLGLLQFTRGSSLGLSMLGESQVVSGMIGSSFVTLNGEVFLRAYGTFPHPNILAGFLVLSLLVGLYFLSVFKNRGKYLSVSLIVVSFVSLIFTFSRIPLLLSCLVLVIYFGFKISKKKLFSFTGVLLLERFTNLMSSSDSSWNDRVNLAKSSFGVIKEKWLVGSGMGEFVSAMKEGVPRTLNGIQLLQPVHNFFLLTLSELGVFGFVSLMGLLGKIFARNTQKLTIFKGLILSVVLVLMMFDHYMFTLPQGIMIFFLLTLLYFFKD